MSRQVATLSPAQHVVHPQGVAPVFVDGLSGGTPGQAASGCSHSAKEGDSGQEAPVSFSSLGGGLGKEASDTFSPVASTIRIVAPSGEGSGQVASGPFSPSASRAAGPPLASVSTSCR